MSPLLIVLSVLLLAALALFVIVRLPARWRSRRRRRRRERLEDALKHIHARELRDPLATIESLAGGLRISTAKAGDLVNSMQRAGLARPSGVGLTLTPAGQEAAIRVIRSHRLLERYFADELRMPLEAVHRAADRDEHRLTPGEVSDLEVRLGYPRTDPHGDPIPTAAGVLPEAATTPLTEWPVGRPARVLHLEDEPEEVFAQIVALGLEVGMRVELVEVSAGQFVLWDGNREYVMAPLLASNVFVGPLRRPVEGSMRLSSLELGQTGRVLSLACEGLSRRRLLDLGLVPGTVVECAMRAPLGEPMAYRIRGATVALRREEADRVDIEPLAEAREAG